MPTPIVTVTLNTAIDRVLEAPNFRVGAHAQAKQLSRYPAGKAINVSRALAKLGHGCIATGFVGQAELPEFDSYLRAAGPGRVIGQLLSVRGKTRENVTIVDPVNHTDTHIRDSGFEARHGDQQRLLTKIGLLARPGVVCVISGSLPPGMDVTALNLLLHVAIGGGARVVLDIGGGLLHDLIAVGGGIDPAPEQDVEPAGGLWMLKPNRQELAEMTGRTELHSEDDVLDAARGHADRVRYIVVTLGADGALLLRGGEAWRGRLAIDPKRVVNTVGCGDCMLAGLLAAHLDGADPPAMLRRGLAVAAANALRSGIAEFDAKQIGVLEERASIDQLA